MVNTLILLERLVKIILQGGEWVTCKTSNLQIAGSMGSNPVRGTPLFL